MWAAVKSKLSRESSNGGEKMSEVVEKPATDVGTPQAGEVERSQPLMRPPVDIFEHDDGFTLMLDMPGVSRDRLDVRVERDRLLVAGDIEIDIPKDMESHYADVRATHYERSFSLSGEQLDTDAVQAELKDGVLKIDIPRREELKPKKIQVTMA